MSKSNITMEFIKLDRKKIKNNSINPIIEPFEGIYKKNSRIIFVVLLLLIAVIYMNSY